MAELGPDRQEPYATSTGFGLTTVPLAMREADAAADEGPADDAAVDAEGLLEAAMSVGDLAARFAAAPVGWRAEQAARGLRATARWRAVQTDPDPAAVRAFLRDHGDSAEAPSARRRLGELTDLHRVVQGELNRTGFNVGAVDGVWGRRSRAALARFLASAGLPNADWPTGDHLTRLRRLPEPEPPAAATEPESDASTVTWSDPDTGRSGSVEPRAAFVDPEGRTCREFQTTVEQNGAVSRVVGVACRMPDGTWSIVE